MKMLAPFLSCIFLFTQVLSAVALSTTIAFDQRGLAATRGPPTRVIPTITTRKINQKREEFTSQIHPIQTMNELLHVMNGDHAIDESEAGTRITLIKYHADYCKLCQRAGIQMQRLPSEFPSVSFNKVEQKVMTAPSAATLRALGVSKFPWIQVYRGGKCVASFSGGPSHLFTKKVRDTLNLCLNRDEDGWEKLHNDCKTEITDNKQVRQQLISGALH